jgi:polyphosphate glucokinase
MKRLGIDIGGTGIKGAVVNTETGELITERHRILTPKPAAPAAVAEVVNQVREFHQWQGPFGCGFPAVVQNGFTRTAANVDSGWIGTNAAAVIEAASGHPVRVQNDADVAGLAEMRFGAGKGEPGVVIIVTIGTGLGTALFSDGKLVPNSELGHLEVNGVDAETMASDSARRRDGLKWKEWAKRFDAFLTALHTVIWPDLIILGGGASKKSHKFLDQLTIPTRVVPAKLLNEAGIVGAAIAAEGLLDG